MDHDFRAGAVAASELYAEQLRAELAESRAELMQADVHLASYQRTISQLQGEQRQLQDENDRLHHERQGDRLYAEKVLTLLETWQDSFRELALRTLGS